MSQQPLSERLLRPGKQMNVRALARASGADTVLFPHAVPALTVGRESSVQLINSLGEIKTIVVVAPAGSPRSDNPQPSDLIRSLLSAVVHKVVRCPTRACLCLPKPRAGAFIRVHAVGALYAAPRVGRFPGSGFARRARKLESVAAQCSDVVPADRRRFAHAFPTNFPTGLEH